MQALERMEAALGAMGTVATAGPVGTQTISVGTGEKARWYATRVATSVPAANANMTVQVEVGTVHDFTHNIRVITTEKNHVIDVKAPPFCYLEGEEGGDIVVTVTAAGSNLLNVNSVTQYQIVPVL